MSTYATSEAALLTLVQAYSGGTVFTGSGISANSSRGDFKVLNNQAVTVAAVLLQARPSELGDDLGSGRGTQGRRQQRHWIAVIVFQARGQTNDGAPYVALTTLTDALIAWLDTYQKLNSAANVKRAQVREVSEVRRQRDQAWIYQTILVEVLTETSPVIVDYAR